MVGPGDEMARALVPGTQQFFYLETNLWRGGRVAEGNGLLNRRMGLTYTEGSNPSLSAIPKASEY